jgi:hypothetical protein
MLLKYESNIKSLSQASIVTKELWEKAKSQSLQTVIFSLQALSPIHPYVWMFRKPVMAEESNMAVV